MPENTDDGPATGSVQSATTDASHPSHRNKRRKVETPDQEVNKYDASHLVPRYTDQSEVPEHLRKYFSQRTRYFSLYDNGCLLDEEGWYSVTPEKMADQIAERCRCDTILDAFCGVGGNAIAFAKTCNRVIALDTSPVRLALARHNAAVYGVADRIEFILADYLDFARSYINRSPSSRRIDVVFLSPPWGGPAYLLGSPTKGSAESTEEQQHPEYSLSSILPIPGDELFRLSRGISRNIAYFLPRNSNLSEISALVPSEKDGDPEAEKVEIEEEWMGNKLKALTCYFGGLAGGQEHLF
ncbi:S-adenosyl-L-methionine-dependent methyltransferase [Rickenella mellea]|uniref:Trimethylguanosine synthase n=1 Tax=Rickenella mellea TaxID=50990 RepID=A0A4Y7QI13_9AGAM|nr:S-adenosyl-L-methionine-dependent methyltransferase [Rickenella mellea]